MESKFKFDKETGTLVSNDAVINQSENVKSAKAEIKRQNINQPTKSAISQPVKKEKPALKFRRIDEPSVVQLTDDNGLPEAYLDSLSTDIVMFRENEDYDLYQIADERTGKVFAYIGGYALQIKFNMAELNTMESIEQCLQGLMKLFRHKIMNQPLSSKG